MCERNCGPAQLSRLWNGRKTASVAPKIETSREYLKQPVPSELSSVERPWNHWCSQKTRSKRRDQEMLVLRPRIVAADNRVRTGKIPNFQRQNAVLNAGKRRTRTTEDTRSRDSMDSEEGSDGTTKLQTKAARESKVAHKVGHSTRKAPKSRFWLLYISLGE